MEKLRYTFSVVQSLRFNVQGIRKTSTVSDGQGYYSTSTNSFPDALVEGIKSTFGMDDTAQTIVTSDNDTAIMAIMYAISWLYYWAITRKSCVIADEGQALAKIARGIWV